MMDKLLKRGDQLAADGQRKRLSDVAQQLRHVFGSAAVHIEQAGVVVSGRGAIKRWLMDPSLRFLAGGLQ
jgi:hypothetical protein